MELLQGGVRVLIRAGTCGAMHTEIEDGDLIIATGGVREDAATWQLMPLAYSAVADRYVVSALIQAARGITCIPLWSPSRLEKGLAAGRRWQGG